MKTIAFILGIRPDLIRASLILKNLDKVKKFKTIFIWSGQHYSDNLKDIFIRELNIRQPDIDLECGGESDAEISSAVISRLHPVLEKIKPETAVFLGDNNTVVGCIAAAQLNIPIVHIEGCMRSYDWRMPEEKYRLLADHLSDVIYVYFGEYKEQGIREGLNPDNIVVVGNPIVDILDRYYFRRKAKFDSMANVTFFRSRNIEKRKYYLMTCHRRENVHVPEFFQAIINLVSKSPYRIYFPASYRTQKVIREKKVQPPKNIIMVDPIGYDEFLTLMVNSRGVLTDSGTIVEEACILQVPSIQMRRSTERPQVYDARSCVKFNPTKSKKYPPTLIFEKLDSLYGKRWKHRLGDGKASQRVVDDLKRRVLEGKLRGHLPENYHISTDRSYREDGIKI